LSDGGHFENTAVYELVRRRCSHIVMVDAGADPARAFEDLGNLIRKCRVDLAAEINLDVDDLYALPSGRSKAGFISGTITYATGCGCGARDRKNPADQADTGRSACRARRHLQTMRAATLPFRSRRHSTRWFDESQFESYRFLGSALTKSAFETHADFFL